MNVELGGLQTHAGRIIVFPNDLQHQVQRLANISETEVKTKKKIINITNK